MLKVGVDMDAVQDLWLEFGDVPMNPETECIESDWHGFPAGTHREDVWHWFEEEFGVPVHVLLYGGAGGGGEGMSWIVLDAAAGALFTNGIDSPLSRPVRSRPVLSGFQPVLQLRNPRNKRHGD